VANISGFNCARLDLARSPARPFNRKTKFAEADTKDVSVECVGTKWRMPGKSSELAFKRVTRKRDRSARHR
jgi:hypothetical protein